MKKLLLILISVMCLMVMPIVFADSIPVNYSIKMWTSNSTSGAGSVQYIFDNGRASGKIVCDGKTYPEDAPYYVITEFVKDVNCGNASAGPTSDLNNFSRYFGQFTSAFNITLDRILGECRDAETQLTNCKISKDNIWAMYTNASNETNTAWPDLLRDCQDKLAAARCPTCDCSEQTKKTQDNMMMYCIISFIAGGVAVYFFMKREKPEQPTSRLPTRGY